MRFKTLIPSLVLLGLALTSFAQPQAKWNVFIYMNAQPDLEKYALQDLQEMALAGSSPDVRVFVQLATQNGAVRRYSIEPGRARLVAELGVIDPLDYRNLTDFVAWGERVSPAQSHGVVIWGHSTGVPESRDGTVLSSPDPDGATLHTLLQAAEQIRDRLGKPIDLWGFDSCLMQRAEVAYGLRDAGRFLVASQDVLGADGWQYDSWLGFLLNHPNVEAEELALTLTRIAAESTTGEERTAACVDLSRMFDLSLAVGEFSDELSAFIGDPGRMASVVTAHYSARRYASTHGAPSAYLDLRDLAGHFTSARFPASLVKSAKRVELAVDSAVRLRFGDPRSSGLSILHQIDTHVTEEYKRLDFCRDTGWDEYLAGGRAARPLEVPKGTVYLISVREPIPDANAGGVLSTVSVQEEGIIRGARLFLSIRHDYIGDLRVSLSAPSGQRAVVLNRIGGKAKNLHGWVESSGMSRLFEGERAQGEWELRVSDLTPDDTGALLAWQLELLLD